jgi:hypothetical protein
MKETIEEVAEKLYPFVGGIGNSENDKKNHFIKGAKWMEERMYSEEDMLKCWNACERFERPISEGYAPNFNQFIENLKKK